MRADALTVPFWSPEEIEEAVRPALDQLERRLVLAYPTETVYGFGGAIDRDSVEALVKLKRRPPGKPFLLLVDGPAMVDRLDLHLPSYAAGFIAMHWPGPLTLVLRGGEGRVQPRLRGPEGGVAVRWTSHTGIARIIRAHGDALTSTSANLPRVPPAQTAAEIVDQWPDAIARGILRVLDGGRLVPSEPSTVVDCTGRHPRIIRPGAIPASVLRESAPTLIGDA
ncbi:MAG TPA: L-threonylcarbamoyladenylate synthase [Gemmatimonadaceae bacterium]|nr:L-threonylcarbamoyladenylate synthase [Gemmatimonadaceae bacterium]